ncbi:hypothetical protein [Bacillus sp. AK031]
MADKKKNPENKNRSNQLDGSNNNRHNENARAAAALEPGFPRINTDNI